MATTNGGPTEELQPQLNVVAQYIKDFSFENPNAPKSLTPSQEAPQISININVAASPMSDSDIAPIDHQLRTSGSKSRTCRSNVLRLWRSMARQRGRLTSGIA